MVRFLAHDCTDDLAGNFNKRSIGNPPNMDYRVSYEHSLAARPKTSSQRFRRNGRRRSRNIPRACFPNLFRTLSGNALCALERIRKLAALVIVQSHLLCRHPNSAIVPPCSRIKSCPLVNLRVRTGRQRKFLSKSSLLPMDSASARQLALTHHLALAACAVTGATNISSTSSHARCTLPISCSKWIRSASARCVHESRGSNFNSVEKRRAGRRLKIASRDASSLEEILALHDEQLGNVPRTVSLRLRNACGRLSWDRNRRP